MLVVVGLVLFLARSAEAGEAVVHGPSCVAGAQECPIELRIPAGAGSVVTVAAVSADHPDCHFGFDARAGQILNVQIQGDAIKTTGGLALTLPTGEDDALDVGTPYKATLTGHYLLRVSANRMSETPYGRFSLTLQIR